MSKMKSRTGREVDISPSSLILASSATNTCERQEEETCSTRVLMYSCSSMLSDEVCHVQDKTYKLARLELPALLT